jgi:IclR family mhp operon transcriptional activator
MSESVRSVRRALVLIRLMNDRESWTLHALAEASGLPKATLHRLLGTLQEEGYVHTFPGLPGLYRLTRRTLELSAGLTDFAIFADLAEPIVIETTLGLSWPVSFAMAEPPFMRVVSCGMPYAPARSAKPTSVERRHWMFSSAVGKAYLSRCSLEEIHAVCEAAVAFCRSSSLALPIPPITDVVRMAADVQANGYAVRIAAHSDLNSAIAVPVFSARSTLGALACSTFPHSLSQRFINATLKTLTEAAERIVHACDEGAPEGELRTPSLTRSDPPMARVGRSDPDPESGAAESPMRARAPT